MTGNKCLLTNLQPSSLDFVIFEDDAKVSVLRSCSLKILGMPKRRDSLLVEGLKANLINIGQLCDQNLFVKFTKDRCIVLDQN